MQTKEEKKEYDRQRYIIKKKEINELGRKYYIAHKDEMLAYQKEYRASHGKEIKEYNKEYNDTHKNEYQTYRVSHLKEHKGYLLKSKYGISTEQYNFLLDKQNGCCNICKKHHSEFKRALAVDHDHVTGIVRGLLCHKCNRGLGYFYDNIDILRNTIEHLKNNPLNL